MRTKIILTVSESKRLIGKGVANLPSVKARMKEGMIAIVMGTTNGHVAEEILGHKISRKGYRRGAIFPAKGDSSSWISYEKVSDVILKDGKVLEDISLLDAVAGMKAGDIFIKGGNALNYDKKLVGILIESPTGGTIGGNIGHIVGKRVELILPVGLEKSIYMDINELGRLLAEDMEYIGIVPRMLPVTGTIITEIEALKVLTEVKAIQISSGGVAGAEGAVQLLIEGDKQQLDRTMALMDTIWGEPPFAEV